MWKLQVKFYLRKNEDCSPRDSTTGGSEKLLQRGSEEGNICDFDEGRVPLIKQLSLQKIFC